MFTNINRISGLSGSGFDTEGTIQKLMQAQRTKYDKMYQKQQLLAWKKDAYREMNTALSALRNSAFQMKLQGSFMVKKTTSSNEVAVTVTSGTAALDGTTKIKIEQLAEGASKTSITSMGSSDDKSILNTQFSGLTGTIKFELNGETIEIDNTSGDKSIYDVVNAINNAGVGVKASYDANIDRFFLNTDGTGANKYIRIKDLDGNNFLAEKLKLDVSDYDTGGAKGKDAKIYLNDMTTPIEQSTNNFTINAITYNLKGTTTGLEASEWVNITVATDVDAVFDNIKKFMDDYNSLIDTVYNKINETYYRNYPPLTDQQKESMNQDDIKKWEEKSKSGLLRRDTILSGVLDNMRFSMITSIAGLDNKSQLTAIGIDTGENYLAHGKLRFSDLTGDELKEAIRNNPDGIIDLFTKDGSTSSEQGIARRLQTIMDTAIKDINNVAGLTTKIDDESILGKQIIDITKRMNSEEARLVKLENRYWAKFTAMEKALSSMANQSMWLSEQLGGGQW